MNEPVLFGRKWGFKFAWAEVAIYSTISLALAYRGWLASAVRERGRLHHGDQPVTLAALECERGRRND